MLVVSISDFSANVERYTNEASVSGLKIIKDGKPFLKILPEKKSKKIISRTELISILKPSENHLWQVDAQEYVNGSRSDREN